MLYRSHRPGEIGPVIAGRVVLDEHGLRLGSVTGLVYRGDGRVPEFLVVNPGPLRRSRYVPVAGACQTPDGEIVVPWDRDWFRLAPGPSGGRRVSAERRTAIAVHYARR